MVRMVESKASKKIQWKIYTNEQSMFTECQNRIFILNIRDY
jgi:hypothetical protein